MIAKVARWKDRLASCEAARSSELACERELDADCISLRFQLSAVEEHLAAPQAKLMETESSVSCMEYDTDVGLRAKVEHCFCNYVNWEIQITK